MKTGPLTWNFTDPQLWVHQLLCITHQPSFSQHDITFGTNCTVTVSMGCGMLPVASQCFISPPQHSIVTEAGSSLKTYVMKSSFKIRTKSRRPSLTAVPVKALSKHFTAAIQDKLLFLLQKLLIFLLSSSRPTFVCFSFNCKNRF